MMSIRYTIIALLVSASVVGCSKPTDSRSNSPQNSLANSMTIPPASETASKEDHITNTLEPAADNKLSSANADNKSKPKSVKVAAIQCSSILGNIQANRDKLTTLVKEAASNGAKIVVLPETSITGYLSQDLRTNWHVSGHPIERHFHSKDPTAFAEPVPGKSTKYFCELAKQLQIYLTIPLLEIDEVTAPQNESSGDKEENTTPRFFNTVCLASPSGELVAHYRKLTPWPYPEKSWATAGDRGVQIYDSEYGRMGLAICYDIHTILEKYEPHKIWALLYPIAWVDESHPADWFWHRLPKRVAPFKHCVIGANWSVDEPQKWYGYGFSTIFDDDGKVIATAKSLYGSEILYATIPTAWAE